MNERIQKILSEAGICSRRAAEKLIEQGHVKVNGITASVGESADIDTDEITVDGKKIKRKCLIFIPPKNNKVFTRNRA